MHKILPCNCGIHFKQTWVYSLVIRIAMPVLCLVFLFGCQLQQRGSEVQIEELEWLTGNWRHTNDTLLENIILQQDYIECVVYHIEDGQAIVRERRRLYNDHGQLRMTTTVFFKETNEFSNFRLKAQKENRLVFENLDPDSQELITFDRTSQTTMQVIFNDRKNGQLRKVELIMDDEP